MNRIKAQLKNFSRTSLFTPSQLSREFNMIWQKELTFQTDAIKQKVIAMTSRAIRKKHLSEREKWLATELHEEISLGLMPDLEIRYINEVFGYGVFAAEPIPKLAFVGEYTGLVRKRTPRVDRQNDYTFAYSIGEWGRNPFIIDAKSAGNLTRFINHSDEPNLEPLSVYANGVMHIVFLSLREIEVGEQLSYHYGDLFWKKRKDAQKLDLNI